MVVMQCYAKFGFDKSVMASLLSQPLRRVGDNNKQSRKPSVAYQYLFNLTT